MAYKDKREERQNKKEYYQKNKETILKRTRLYSKKWYQTNKKKILQQSKKYYQQNEEGVKQRHRKYNQKNKEKLLQYKGEWQKYRRKTNPQYRLNENMDSAIARSLKGKKAGRKWETLVDYALKELMEHLEKQFDSKMNWRNYGSYWVVDHIKPRDLFNYSSPNNLQFKQCWTLKNLQPLEKITNIKKRNHVFNY